MFKRQSWILLVLLWKVQRVDKAKKGCKMSKLQGEPPTSYYVFWWILPIKISSFRFSQILCIRFWFVDCSWHSFADRLSKVDCGKLFKQKNRYHRNKHIMHNKAKLCKVDDWKRWWNNKQDKKCLLMDDILHYCHIF